MCCEDRIVVGGRAEGPCVAILFFHLCRVVGAVVKE